MSFSNFWSRATGASNPSQSRRRKHFKPAMTRLEDRTVPNGYVALGAGAGAPPLVAIRVDKVNSLLGSPPNNAGEEPPPSSDGKTDFTSQIFYAYDRSFTGGVRVAAGNFDGDYTTPDSLVTGAGTGGGPHVIIWQTTEAANGNITVTGKIDEFYAFDRRFTGGVNVATGDLDGDGQAELIVAAGPGGGPHVKIYKFGADNRFHLALEFFAYDASFRGGVSVASGQGYQTPVEIRQVLDEQLPDNFADNFQITPYIPPDSRPGLNLVDPNLDFPLVGGIGVFDPDNPNNPFPGPSNTTDDQGIPLPYFTVGSGVLQYGGANLLNSYGNIAYNPNVFDPFDPDPPATQPLVFATWSQDSDFPPDFPYIPDVAYGPFVEVFPAVGGDPAIVTRLTEGPGQVNARNQLILGAGPGGAPHVRVLDIIDDGNGGLQINESVDFYAFDAKYTGGINVAIGSFIDLPNPTLDTITLNGNTFGVVSPGRGATITQVTFPYDTNIYRQFQAQILVTQMAGNQAVVWSDFKLDPTEQRTSITQLNLSPTYLDTKVVFDGGNPLGGFYSLQDTTTFTGAIDPQFNGVVVNGITQLLLDGTAATARSQTAFGAGTTFIKPSRGTHVRIFDSLGPTSAQGIPPALIAAQTPVDDFFAFTAGYFPNGLAGIAYGYGVLPNPTRDIVELAPISVETIDDPFLF